MTERFSEADVVTTVTRLTRSQLFRFVEAEFVRPERDGDGFVFTRVDIARLELLCDLSQDLELDDTALDVILSLIDQLHAAKQEIEAMRRAIAALPEDLRASLADAVKRS